MSSIPKARLQRTTRSLASTRVPRRTSSSRRSEGSHQCSELRISRWTPLRDHHFAGETVPTEVVARLHGRVLLMLVRLLSCWKPQISQAVRDSTLRATLCRRKTRETSATVDGWTGKTLKDSELRLLHFAGSVPSRYPLSKRYGVQQIWNFRGLTPSFPTIARRHRQPPPTQASTLARCALVSAGTRLSSTFQRSPLPPHLSLPALSPSARAHDNSP